MGIMFYKIIYVKFKKKIKILMCIKKYKYHSHVLSSALKYYFKMIKNIKNFWFLLQTSLYLKN